MAEGLPRRAGWVSPSEAAADWRVGRGEAGCSERGDGRRPPRHRRSDPIPYPVFSSASWRRRAGPHQSAITSSGWVIAIS